MRSNTGSRRQSLDGETGPGCEPGASIFGGMKPLKKSKPVSTVKITFMGKPMVIDYYYFLSLSKTDLKSEKKIRGDVGVNIQQRNVN